MDDTQSLEEVRTDRHAVLRHDIADRCTFNDSSIEHTGHHAAASKSNWSLRASL